MTGNATSPASEPPGWRSIVITGASSGIGRALAECLAGPDRVLGLVGRDGERLRAVAETCVGRGATVEIAPIDIRQREDLRAWLLAFDARAPINLLIANAGVMGGLGPGEDCERPDISWSVIETDLVGTLNTVHPALEAMVRRRSGQIAIMSSLSGFIPQPDAPSYGASKAALLSYGMALRTQHRQHGVRINVICPGYVATPMTAMETGWKPFEMSAARAAGVILRGLRRDTSVIAFPRFFALITWIGGRLPEGVRRVTSQPFRFKVTNSD